MNRQYRRELQRQEKIRQKRADRLVQRRQRLRSRWQQQRAAAPNLRGWLLRPYKSIDMLMLFLLLWGMRWVAFQISGGPGTSPAAGFSWELVVAQAAFALVTLAYIFGIAREGLEWNGPPGRALPPVLVWAGGLLAGAIVYGLGRALASLLIPSVPSGMTPVEAGLASAVRWTELVTADLTSAALALVAFVLAAPLADELLYRRILGRLFLRHRMSERWVIVSSAVLSTLGSAGLFPLPAAAAAGFVLAYLWMRTQSTGLVVIARVLQAALLVWAG